MKKNRSHILVFYTMEKNSYRFPKEKYTMTQK